MTAIANLYYLPSISYFSNLVEVDELLFECHENYQKRTPRNRCWLAGPNGKVMLSIPLKKGKNAGQSIRDVQISYESNWHDIHWKTILTNYSTSPYLAFYVEVFEKIYHEKYLYLWDFNMALFEVTLNILQHPLKIEKTSAFISSYESNILDLRDNFNESMFGREHEIYPQVFSYKYDFLSDLSIFDAIMCLGPEVGNYLKRS